MSRDVEEFETRRLVLRATKKIDPSAVKVPTWTILWVGRERAPLRSRSRACSICLAVQASRSKQTALSSDSIAQLLRLLACFSSS